MTFIDRMI